MISPWTRNTIINEVWRRMPASRKRIHNQQREVLIYNKANGTYWATLNSLSGKQLILLDSERLK